MADHFVIDGSNLATEGRTEPSLAQLQEAVAAFKAEHPDATTTVVVDASFEHRIDPAERAAFDKTQAANDVVSPPAGAVGRGDGFLLQIADRIGGSVLSNDSFQEFHAEYEWLFEPGRLIGGKPVPGVGWIFSLRRPVRGIVSRKTVQKAKGEKDQKKVQKAIAEATASAMEPDSPKRRRRRGGRGRSSASAAKEQAEPEAVNEPATFLQFVIDHRLGTEVNGTVDAFASHGAFVVVDGVKCYVPLSAMGDPQPSRARDVLTKDETRTFVVQAVDAPRRGIELGLPGFAKVAGAPSEETVEAEVRTRRTRGTRGKKATPDAKSAKPAKTPSAKVSKKAAKPASAKSSSQDAAPEKATKKPAKQTKKSTRTATKTAPAKAKSTKASGKGKAEKPSKAVTTPAPESSPERGKRASRDGSSAQQPAKRAKTQAARQAAKRKGSTAKKAAAKSTKAAPTKARKRP